AVANGYIGVTVEDDAPVAVADTNRIDEDGLSVSGNVVAGTGTGTGLDGKDGVGADGAKVTEAGGNALDATNGTVVAGTYGDLTIYEDGSYTYTLVSEGDDRYDDLQALSEYKEDGNNDSHLGVEKFN